MPRYLSLVISSDASTNMWYLFTGILCEDGTIDNEPSIQRLAEVALNYAKAG